MAFSGLGAGTVGDPYQITTPLQFREMNCYIGNSVFTGTGINDFNIVQTFPGYGGVVGDYFTFTIKSTKSIQSIWMVNGGSGYAVNDTFTIEGGLVGYLATGKVTAVSGGVVTGVLIQNTGSGYTATSGWTTTAITGVGVGLTIIVNAVNNDQYTWKKNTGSESALQTMSSTNSVTQNLSIKFNAVTGHTVGDVWVLTVAKLYFKLQNDITFSGETTANKILKVGAFFGSFDGDNYTISNILADNSVGFELRDGCTISNAKFTFTEGTLTVGGYFLDSGSSYLNSVTLSSVHVVITNNAVLWKFSSHTWNATCTLSHIVIEGNILGVFTAVVRCMMSHIKVLRLISLYFNSPSKDYPIVNDLDDGAGMEYCQMIMPKLFRTFPEGWVIDYAIGLLAYNIGNASINQCMVWSNMDITYATTGTIAHGFSVVQHSNGVAKHWNNCIFNGSLKVNAGAIGSGNTADESGFLIAGVLYGYVDKCIANADVITPTNTNRPVLKKKDPSGNKETNNYYKQSRITGMTPVDIVGEQEGLSDVDWLDSSKFVNFDFSTVWEMGSSGPKLINNPVYAYDLTPRTIMVTEMVRDSSTQYTLKVAAEWATETAQLFGIEIYHNGVLFQTTENQNNVVVTVDGLSDIAIEVRPYFLDGVTKSFMTYFTATHYCMDGAVLSSTTIAATQKVTFDTPIIAKWIHGSCIVGDYIYGSSRNTTPSTFPCITRALMTNLAGYTEIPIKLSDSSSFYGVDIEQLVVCGGKIYGRMSGKYVIQFDPVAVDYKIFWINEGAGSNEPIATDGTYLYLIGPRYIYKVNPSVFDGASKYNTDVPFTITTAGMYDGGSQGGYLTIGGGYADKGACHSVIADSTYLYVAYTTGGDYSVAKGRSLNELHKVRISDMTAAGWVWIPKCTDDMCQTDTHLFMGVEVQAAANVGSMGYGWGGCAVKKSNLTVLSLPKYTKDDNPPTIQSYASLLFGNYLLDSKTDRSTYILDISDVDNWSVNEPVGKRTLKRYKYTWQGTTLLNSPNEFLLSPAGKFYAFIWENPGSLMEVDLTGLNYFAAPTINTIGSAVVNNDVTLTGYILNTGGKTITEKGFKYGSAPDQLTHTVINSTEDVEFSNTVNLAQGLYYYKAYAINAEGESTSAETLSFSVANIPSLSLLFSSEDGRKLYLNCSEPMSNSITGSEFTLKKGLTTLPIIACTVNDNIIELSLSTPITYSQEYSLYYDSALNPVYSLYGGLLPSISGDIVTNNALSSVYGFSGLGYGDSVDPFQITNSTQFNEMNGFIGKGTFTGTGLNDGTFIGINSAAPGTIYRATIESERGIKTSVKGTNQGTGYAINDTFTVNGGSILATGKVTGVIGNGLVNNYTILTIGSGYSIANGVATTRTSGNGSGFQINITELNVDRVSVQINGGVASILDVSTTGTLIGNSVSIKFDALTGHSVGDYWEVTIAAYHFQLQNDIDFSDQISPYNSINITNFFHSLDGQNFSVNNLVFGTTNGIILKDGTTIKDITFRVNNPTLPAITKSFLVATTLNNGTLTNIHAIFTNNAKCRSFAFGSYANTCTINNIVVEGNIGGVFSGTVYGLVEHVKVLRTGYYDATEYDESYYAIAGTLEGTLRYCQVIMPYMYCAQSVDGYKSMMVHNLNGKIEQSFVWANLDINYINTNAAVSTQIFQNRVVNTTTANHAITDCYYIGNFLVNGGQAPDTGSRGGNKSGYIFSANKYMTVARCYSAGDIYSPENDNRTIHQPSTYANIQKCYYDGDRLVSITDISQTGLQQVLSPAQMANSANYDTWDFATVWEMGADNLPKLRNNPLYNFELPMNMLTYYGTIRNNANSYTPSFRLDYFEDTVPEFGIEVYHDGIMVDDIIDNNIFTIDMTSVPIDTNVVLKPYWWDGVTKTYSIKEETYTHYKEDGAVVPAELVELSQNATLNNPILAKYVHGSYIYNGYLYGSTRNPSPSTTLASIVKAPLNNLSTYVEYLIKLSDVSTTALRNFDQIVECGGYLYTVGAQYLVQFDPFGNDYKIFQLAASLTGTNNEPIGTDGTYLYISTTRYTYKIDPIVFVNAVNKYNVSTVFDVPIAATYDSYTQGGYIEGGYTGSDKGQLHSFASDNDYLWLFYTTNGAYNETYGKSLNECHKVRKNDMTAAGWVGIPKCTDDMSQNKDYVFGGVEVQPTEDPRALGYGWSVIAVRKSDLRLTGLPRMHDTDHPPTNQTYGTLIFGENLVNLATNFTSYILDISDPDSWSPTENVGKRTLRKFDLQSGGVTLTININEILKVSGNDFFGFLWSNPSQAVAFTLPPPTLSSVGHVNTVGSTVTGNSVVLDGYIIDDGGEPINNRGFVYGLTPEMTETLYSSGEINSFSASLNNLPGGTYYYAAFVNNSYGNGYGETLQFIIEESTTTTTTTTTIISTTTTTTIVIETTTTTTTNIGTTTTTTTINPGRIRSNQKLRAFVKYDVRGNIVPSSLILAKEMPATGKWKEINIKKLNN